MRESFLDHLEPSWREALRDQLNATYFRELSQYLVGKYAQGSVYPPKERIFRAFELCPFNTVEVVILGQDPYHNPGQANGLCFAVDDTVRLPPSLKNIYKEIESDLGRPIEHTSGDLERWARQGVLLLNATLTVDANKPGSHQGKGWEQFTDAAIHALSEKREHLVFMLWGNYAKNKGTHIDRTKHLVLESPHPSPFSAYNGFFGNKHFSKANSYLEDHNKNPIEWT